MVGRSIAWLTRGARRVPGLNLRRLLDMGLTIQDARSGHWPDHPDHLDQGHSPLPTTLNPLKVTTSLPNHPDVPPTTPR